VPSGIAGQGAISRLVAAPFLWMFITRALASQRAASDGSGQGGTSAESAGTAKPPAKEDS
jgi:hypothetical protein